MMKNMKNKGIVLVTLVAMLVMNLAMAVFADDVKVQPQITVVGETVYVDVADEQSWNSLQVNMTFDKSAKVADYGQTEEFAFAIAEQGGLIGFPICNVVDGEFIAAAAYTSTSADGSGVNYTGHVFYVTFEDASSPIQVELRDEDGNVIAKGVVDGSAEEQVITEGDGMESQSKTITIIIVGVVAVVVLAAAAVVSSKNKKNNGNVSASVSDDEDEE